MHVHQPEMLDSCILLAKQKCQCMKQHIEVLIHNGALLQQGACHDIQCLHLCS